MGKYEKNKGTVQKEVPPKQKTAAVKIFVAWLTVIEALAVVVGLWALRFISVPFAVILSAGATGYGLFKTGYFWRDIKF